MRVIASGKGAGIYSGAFTGEVELELLDPATAAERPDTAVGQFRAGATTHWHAHPGGQLLWVVEGRARVGTVADGEVELAPGTLVGADPLERHWHGAAAGHDAVILSLTWGTTVWEDAPAP